MTDEIPPPSSAWPDTRERIASRYFDLLEAAGSPLLGAGESIREQLRSQLLAIVDEAVGFTAPDTTAPGLSATIGRERASRGVHPSASLAAATMIFAASLDEVSAHLAAESVPEPLQTAALRLNAAILQRMADAAANYVDFLLAKAGSAHRDEALRLSRELHDTVGPAIAVGLQNLDLIEYWNERDPHAARARIQSGREQLHDAMALVRALAAETRVTVEPGGLVDALRRHLATLPRTITTRFTSDEDLTHLSAHYASETFLILREAIRNATQHSNPSTVTVDLTVTEAALTASVTDDGDGFDVESTARGTGRASMQERADLIGADLVTVSRASGTTVTLTVPLPTGAPHAT
ncbi:sensor histidine kinase [Nocardioides jiangxiensis]|uniref:Histidine kinase n=1 Tax=Nocardioides jiangxiensis TaxID=3064524 RepID=A0ABT9AXG0_9ACTN|nr:histidine kinase [Nocardioides sp. WY-20]MDO7867230.1 histidine kinase [Nocardioides sp. WY-20]